MKKEHDLVFREVQLPRRIWIWLSLLLCARAAVKGFGLCYTIEQH
ncbi:hypothetical protein [Oceanobacillus locisalsi]|uniref:Uncharacterized protein n=1 Tax=Oceanobacillus locisalsi TaxID=546107 RepID=A0ABW3NKB2_9BACI